jgi:hypothetical protein
MIFIPSQLRRARYQVPGTTSKKSISTKNLIQYKTFFWIVQNLSVTGAAIDSFDFIVAVQLYK